MAQLPGFDGDVLDVAVNEGRASPDPEHAALAVGLARTKKRGTLLWLPPIGLVALGFAAWSMFIEANLERAIVAVVFFSAFLGWGWWYEHWRPLERAERLNRAMLETGEAPTDPDTSPGLVRMGCVSAFYSWVIVGAVGGALLGMLGLEGVAYGALPVVAVGLWAGIWWAWWHHAHGADTSARAPTILSTARRLWLATVVTVTCLGVVVAAIETSGGLGRSEVAMAPVLAGVGVATAAAVAGWRWWVPALDSSELTALVGSWRSRFAARLAWATLPALAGLAGFLALGDHSWIFGIGLTACLAGLAATAPTRRALRRTQDRLDQGTDLDLLEVLTTPTTNKPHRRPLTTTGQRCDGETSCADRRGRGWRTIC